MSDTLNSLKQIASKQQKIYSPFEEKVETKHEYVPRSKSIKHNTRADEVEKISRKIDKLYKDSNTIMDDVFEDIDIGDQNTNVKSSLIAWVVNMLGVMKILAMNMKSLVHLLPTN